MEQKEIEFIRSRWASRACGTDVQKLVDEIDRLSDVVERQTSIIEDRILDDIEGQPDDELPRMEY